MNFTLRYWPLHWSTCSLRVKSLIFLVAFVIGLINAGLYAATITSNGAGGGNWGTGATWSGGAVPATNDIVIIAAGDVVVADYTDTYASITINNTGTLTLNNNGIVLTVTGTTTVSGTMTATAVLTTAGRLVSNTVTITSTGTFTNSTGNASAISIANFSVNNSGTYNHDAVGSSVGGSTADFPGSTSKVFGASSNVIITKWANGSAPTNLPAIANPGWGNLTINVASLGGSWNQVTTFTNVQGNLSISATGGGTNEFRLLNAGTVNLQIGGNLTISNTARFVGVAGSSGNISISVGGNLDISGSSFFQPEGGTSGNVSLSVTGATTMSGTATFSNTGSATSLTMNFSSFLMSGGTFTPSGNSGAAPTITATGAMTISGGATTVGTTATVVYNLSSLSITGGTFALSGTSGSDLTVNNSNDISISGTGSMSSTSSGSWTINCTGNFSVTSSSATALQFQNSSSASKNYNLNIGGNLVFNGTGTIKGGSSSSNGYINMTGGVASATYFQSGVSYGNSITFFTINSGKTVTLLTNFNPASSSTSNYWGMTVNSGGALNCSTYDIGVANNYTRFTLNSGGTVITAHTGGVWKNTAGQASITTTTTYTSFNSGGNFTFNGSSPQITSLFATTSDPQVNNFTFANTAGVTLSKSFQANGTVALNTDGLVYLNGFNLTIGSAGTAISPGAGSFSATRMIVADAGGSGGYLIKSMVSSSAYTMLYPIGDISSPDGNQYSPVNISITTNAGTSGSIGFNVTDAVHPNIGTVTDYITRYWNVYNSGGLSGGYSWTGTFTYTAADIVGTEANYKVADWYPSLSYWEEFTSSSAAGNVGTVSGAQVSPTLLNGRQITLKAATPLYYYRTNGAGSDWSTATNWNVSVNPSFIPESVATVPPSYLNSLLIWVQNGHTINVTATGTTGDQMQIDGIMNMNTGTFTLYDGTGTDMPISTTGRVNVNTGFTTFTSNSGSTINIEGYWYNQVVSGVTTHNGTYTVTANGTFENGANGGTIIPATWTAGSPGALCYITGNTSNSPGGLGQNFYHFKWENTPTANIGLGLGSLGTPMEVWGDMTVINGAASNEIRLFSVTNGGTLNVHGNLYLQNGILAVQNSGAGAVASSGILTVFGDISLTGGRMYIAGNGANSGAGTPTVNAEGNVSMTSASSNIYVSVSAGTSAGIFNIKGDLTITNGQVRRTGGTGTINLIKASGVQAVTTVGVPMNTDVLIVNIGNGTTTNTVNLSSNFALSTAATATLTVYDQATLNCGTYVVSGNTFTLNSGGTLGIGSTAGIASAGATGNVQTTTRNFNTGGNYVYNGTTGNQITGTGLPSNATITGYVTITNTTASPNNIVTLTNNTSSPYTSLRTLNLNNGYLSLNSGTLYMDGVIAGPVYSNINQNGGDMVGGGTSLAGTVYFRAPGNVNSISAGFPNFYNAIVEGSGAGVNFSGNATIKNSLQINAGGLVVSNAPTYANGSTLIYNPSGAYSRGVEWNATSGNPGYPWHVIVQNGTSLSLATNSITPATLAIGGDLTLGTASQYGNMTMDNNANRKPLTVNGNVYVGKGFGTASTLTVNSLFTIQGDLTLGTGAAADVLNLGANSGDDLYLYGNFTRYNLASYSDNTRGTWFKGTSSVSISTVPANLGQTIYAARFDKTNGTEIITLNTPVTLTSEGTFNKGIVNTTSTNLLTFETGAITNGTPGTTSYINGPAAKKMGIGASAEFVFPLGKSTGSPVYNPAGIIPVSITSATTFTAEYFVGPNQAQGLMGINLMGITNLGYWDISNSVTAGNTARVKLYYTPPGNGNWIRYDGSASSPYYTTAADPCYYCNVAVVHRDSPVTWNFTSSSGNFNTTDPETRFYGNQGFIYSHDPMSVMSRFSLGYSFNSLLPVQLLSFTGKLQNTDGLLSWNVTNSQDLAGFELQHSRDGRNFGKLANIAPNVNNLYSYLHKQLPSGGNFYRLKLVEKNGDFSYSNIVLLTLGKLRTQIIGLKENPVRSNLNVLIASASNQKVEALITDASGRLITRVNGLLQTGQNQWNVQTPVLARGVYFIQLQTGDGEKATIRFMRE